MKAWLHPSVRLAAAASTWLAAPSPTSRPLFKALPTRSLSASSKGVRCSGIACVTGCVPGAMSEILYHVDSRQAAARAPFPRWCGARACQIAPNVKDTNSLESNKASRQTAARRSVGERIFVSRRPPCGR